MHKLVAMSADQHDVARSIKPSTAAVDDVMMMRLAQQIEC